MKALAALLVLIVTTANVRADNRTAPREETVQIDDPGAGRKQVALGLAIGGTALVLSSIAVSVVTHNRYERCVKNGVATPAPDNADCPYDDVFAATEYANHQQAIARYAGTSLFVAGTVALGTALYLRLTAPMKRRVVRVGVAPKISSNTIGLSLTGGF